MAIYLIICWAGQKILLGSFLEQMLSTNKLSGQLNTYPRCQARCQQRAVVTTHGVLLGKKHIEQADGSREGCCGSGGVEHGVTWKRSVGSHETETLLLWGI